MEALERLPSTQEAIVALNYTFCDSYMSGELSNLPHVSITWTDIDATVTMNK